MGLPRCHSLGFHYLNVHAGWAPFQVYEIKKEASLFCCSTTNVDAVGLIKS